MGQRTVRRHRPLSSGGFQWKHSRRLWLIGILFVLLFEARASCSSLKGHKQSLEKFFCSVDQDGDGEIGQLEATKFLELVGGDVDLSKESKDSNAATKDGSNDLLFPQNFGFSYGGATICAEEMQDHLQNMLTADRVVDWITHGLQLPQYAEVFRQNAINGLDFPALIENESFTLTEELGVQSALHRTKITQALVRQVFGLGAIPGPPQEVQCEPADCNGILLRWESPLSNGYPPMHKYLIQRWDSGASSWLSSVEDTKESSFLDKNGLFPGRNYSYRIRAWGGHGPSEWEVLSCPMSHTALSAENCHFESISGFTSLKKIHAAEDFTHSMDAASFKPSSVKSLNTNEKEGSGSKTSLGWIFSFNTGLLILGILSRNSYFFHLIVTTWVIFRIKFLGYIKSKLVQAQDSQFMVVRNLARGFLVASVYWNCVHAKMLLLSKCNSRSPSPCPFERKFLPESDATLDWRFEMVTAINRTEDSKHSMDSSTNVSKKEEWSSSFNKINEGSGCQETFNTVGMVVGDRSICENILPVMDVETARDFILNKSKMALSKQVLFSGNIHDESCIGLSSQPDAYNPFTPGTIHQGDKNFLSDDEIELKVHTTEKTIKYPNFPRGSSAAPRKSRYMCNFESCKARFDRWFSLPDWRMKFSKHYCCECQFVFCVKHIRISPHGPIGQCGLDSSCVCFNCFKGLSSEAQQKFEKVNKLRVGPPAGRFSRKGREVKITEQVWDSVFSTSHVSFEPSVAADTYPDNLLDKSFVHAQEVGNSDLRKLSYVKGKKGRSLPFQPKSGK